MKGTKRKHRLLSILLSSMLVVSMMPAMGSVAYAAEYTKVGDVSEEVTGTLNYEKPVLGEANPTVKSYLNAKITSPLNKGVSVTNIKWQKWNSETGKWDYFKGEHFEPGEYRLCGQLRTDKFSDGTYYALATNPTVTINGKTWEIIGTLSDYYATYGYGYTFHYSETYTVETPAGTQPISIKKEGEGTATASVLAAGYGETVTLTATPRNGYKFKEWRIDSGGIVMSDATSADNSFTMCANPVVITAVFEELPLTKLGEVEAVTGELKFEEPALGATNPTASSRLNATITSPNGKGVTFTQVYWQKRNSESEKWESFKGAQFEPGEYRLCGQLCTKELGDRTYYALIEDATLIINGESWECLGTLSDYYASDGYGYKWHVSKVFEVHGHSFSSTWNSNETHHWKECTTLGCGVIIEESKAAHTAGSWIVDKEATDVTEGNRHMECTVCHYVMKTEVIPAGGAAEPEKKTLDSASAKLSTTSYVYTGSYRTPAVTVLDGTYKLVKGTDYEVTYSSNKYVGTAKVTIKGIGAYEGEIVKTFKINPSKVTLSKVSKVSSGKLKATWKKHSTQTTGFQVRYSTSSTFKTYKTVTVSGKNATYKTVSKLKKGKKYYVKVRAYKTLNGTKYYGSWSDKKYVRV